MLPDKCTDIESTDHLILAAVCVSMPTSFFSILMAAAWLSPKTTTEKLHAPGGNTATAMKSVVVDPSAYDWEGDKPLSQPTTLTIIYEMHVRGFTLHPSSGVNEKTRGTYRGLIEKIPYLHELGITAVELLPVFQFDAQDCPAGLVNYWGYAPVSFFAPHQAYSSCQDPLARVDEFRDMVKALHRAGIEVILDVVFNHTTEGEPAGQRSVFAGLTTAHITFWNKTVRNMPTTAEPETRSMPIIRSCAA